MNKKPRIVICMDGGLIHEVITDCEVEVMLIDKDIEGAAPSDLFEVPQIDDSTEEAYVVRLEITESPGRVSSLFHLIEEEGA